MKKRIVFMAVLVLVIGVVSGVVFAGSKVDFDAELLFQGATCDTVVLNITNRGRNDILISKDAHYIDEFGTAGSWKCTAEEDIIVEPGQSKYIRYQISEAVAHGDHSIMAFYFLHDDYWYLAKTGVEYGLEIYMDHD